MIGDRARVERALFLYHMERDGVAYPEQLLDDYAVIARGMGFQTIGEMLEHRSDEDIVRWITENDLPPPQIAT